MHDTVYRTEYLLEFFKVLADEKRLQIVGLLARQDYSVEELATILDLSSATVSHHLRRLEKAGLVQATSRPALPHLLAPTPDLARDVPADPLAGRVAGNHRGTRPGCVRPQGAARFYGRRQRLSQIPRQWKKREVILRYLLEQFEPDRRYTEREVNEIISRTHERLCHAAPLSGGQPPPGPRARDLLARRRQE